MEQNKLNDLYATLASISDPADIAALLDDLCTVNELTNMSERLFVARLLLDGSTYNQVMAQTNISSATLSRISRCVQQGKGYAKLLAKE